MISFLCFVGVFAIYSLGILMTDSYSEVVKTIVFMVMIGVFALIFGVLLILDKIEKIEKQLKERPS